MGTLTLVLLVCVGIDVSNPLLPGSFRFNPDECIEVVHAERARVGSPTERIAFRPATERPAAREVHAMRGPGPDTRRRPPPVLRPRSLERSDLAPPADDH